LLNDGFDPNSRTSDGGLTPLMLVMPDVDKARVLVERGAQIDARSRQRRYSALLLAAQSPEGAAAVRFLVEKGATIDRQAGEDAPSGNVSPLFAASVGGSPEVLSLLRAGQETMNRSSTLSFGATLTPLAAAVTFRRIDTVRALVALGADVRNGDGLNRPVLSMAMLGNHIEIARLLLAAGADVNRVGDFPVAGTTALHLASYIDHGDTQMIDLLLQAGARVDARDANGHTALDVAEQRQHTHALSRLRAAAAAAPPRTTP